MGEDHADIIQESVISQIFKYQRDDSLDAGLDVFDKAQWKPGYRDNILGIIMPLQDVD